MGRKVAPVGGGAGEPRRHESLAHAAPGLVLLSPLSLAKAFVLWSGPMLSVPSKPNDSAHNLGSEALPVQGPFSR